MSVKQDTADMGSEQAYIKVRNDDTAQISFFTVKISSWDFISLRFYLAFSVSVQHRSESDALRFDTRMDPLVLNGPFSGYHA